MDHLLREFEDNAAPITLILSRRAARHCIGANRYVCEKI